MGFYVVQWEEEESVSVVSGKDVLEQGKEGACVTVITRGAKGKAQIYKASVLRIFPNKAQALEYEKELTRPKLTVEDDGEGQKRIRKRSRKILESKGESDDENEEVQSASKKQKSDSKKMDEKNGQTEKPKEKAEKCKDKAEKKIEKKLEKDDRELKASVQTERVKTILSKKRLDMDEITIIDEPPLPSIASHQTTNMSSNPSFNINTNTGIGIRPTSQMTSNANDHIFIPPYLHSTPNHSAFSTSLSSTPHSNASYISSSSASPIHNLQTADKTFQNMLQDINAPMHTYNMNGNGGSDNEWQSFTSTMTAEMERMKAEIEHLKDEVKSLKSKLHLKKNKPLTVEDGEADCNQMESLIKNASKPLEGAKILLLKLFTVNEISSSSLKGIKTANGTSGMDKSRMNLLYTIMEKRYPDCTRSDVDKWIRGQQKKIRNQLKNEELKKEQS